MEFSNSLLICGSRQNFEKKIPIDSQPKFGKEKKNKTERASGFFFSIDHFSVPVVEFALLTKKERELDNHGMDISTYQSFLFYYFSSWAPFAMRNRINRVIFSFWYLKNTEKWRPWPWPNRHQALIQWNFNLIAFRLIASLADDIERPGCRFYWSPSHHPWPYKSIKV